MHFRRLAVAAALATAVVVPASSSMAVAAGSNTAGHHQSAKPADRPSRAKFSATGTVTAVDAAAGTVTIKVKTGTKDVRRKTVTVAVPDNARIRVNGAAAETLADIAVGYRIAVVGIRTDKTYTATRVEARQVKPHPAPSPTPSPSNDDATPEPSHTESPDHS